MSLEDRLRELIIADGPMPVSTWMALCLHDPQYGYYATRPGLGRDFITAPETSQVFGEMIGAWAAHEWQAMGAPAPFQLCELGPGRATLMHDALRATRNRAPFQVALALQFIEASPVMRAAQSAALAPREIAFHDDLASLPDAPAVLIGNEFLDCLPARQFLRSADGWRERVVGLGEDGAFQLGLAVDRAPPTPHSAETAQVDLQPGLETIIDALAARRHPFRALFLDYGPSDRAPADTVRAYRNGEQVSMLEAPGRCDLTVDVDFARLSALARAAGLDVAGPVSQGAFLGALGIEPRMQALIAANPDQDQAIYASVSKLVEPAQMGERFKVICLSSAGLPPPAGL